MAQFLPNYIEDSRTLERHVPRDQSTLLYAPQALPWRKHLERDELTGKIFSNIENVRLCLTECPELAGLIWWEIEEGRAYVIGKMPSDWVFAPDQFRPMRRDDVTEIQIFIQQCGLHEIDRGTVFWAIRNTAQRYHSFWRGDFFEDNADGG